MNAPNQEHERIEHLLRRAELSGPSARLKRRVTEAAMVTWQDTALDVPWLIPLRRLALSAAAALVLVSAANYFSERAIARAVPGRPAGVDEAISNLMSLDVPDESLRPHRVLAGRRSPVDGYGVKEHIDAVDRALDEAQQHNPSHPSPSSNGRSQQSLDRFRLASWSWRPRSQGDLKCIEES